MEIDSVSFSKLYAFYKKGFIVESVIFENESTMKSVSRHRL